MNELVRRLGLALVTAAAASAALPATASATELLSERLSVASPADRTCFDRLRTGDGVVRRDFKAPATGALTARLRAASGDWDLAVFPAGGGDSVASSATSGPEEVAGGYAFRGEELTLQACRRSGGAESADVTVVLDAIDTSGKPETLSLVDVSTPTRKSKKKLAQLDLDLAEHGGKGFVGVVLHGPDDAAKLKSAGFSYKVDVPDLAAQAKRDRAADERFSAERRASALPSGRTEYRHLADYGEGMKQLAAENPDLIKPISLPHKTYEGRTVEGIEITTNPNARDGKPVFLQMGAHHAREWPSAEHALEWAYQLVKDYRAGDARARDLLSRTRTIVIPVVNPDGFNASREAGELQGAGDGRGTPNPGQEDETVNIVSHPQEYRRKNCRLPDDSEAGSCAPPGAGLAENGVDPNRNYGGFWGGTGASGDPSNLTYFGPAPFSEPETRNVRHVVSTRHVTTLITNHTFSNLVLRPPGLQIQGETPDEPIYRALGQEMADENGYENLFSYGLYDTTGTTEDWSYYATGGLGYTFEIGCVDKGTTPGGCETGHFHPPFAEMVKEYDGETVYSDAGGRDGKGNREAYYQALENTADRTKHAVLSGRAPAGAVLRLKKQFDTPTSQENDDGSRRTFQDTLDTTIEVPSSGNFEWHINQSTRPLVIKDRGRQPSGPPSPEQTFEGDPSGPPSDGALPCGDADTTSAGCYNEHPFTVPASGDNAVATIRVDWATEASDWDMKVYRDADGSGTVSSGDEEIGASEQGPTSFEQTTIAEPILQAGGEYVVRMTNFAATEPYEGTITFGGPEFQAAQRERWTLTCETTTGDVRTTQQLEINRGQAKTVDLRGCATRAPGAPAGEAPGGGGGGPAGPGNGATGKDKRDKPRLRHSVRFTFDGRFYRARVRGRLTRLADRDGLSGASAGRRCAGSVTINIKGGKRRVILRHTKVSRRCTFAKTLRFSRTRVPRKYRRVGRRLRAVSRYNGSKFLLPAKKVSGARIKRR